MHKHPRPALVEREFRRAGGTSNGLSMLKFLTYWSSRGIAGDRVTSGVRVSYWQAQLERAIRRYKALIVVFRFDQGDAFGEFFAPSGLHVAVVDGFTPEGPLVVTWGRTIQMDWVDWYPEAVEVFRVAAA